MHLVEFLYSFLLGIVGIQIGVLQVEFDVTFGLDLGCCALDTLCVALPLYFFDLQSFD